MTPKAENTDCDLHGEARILTSADKELLNKMYQCKQGCCGSLSETNGVFFIADFGKLRPVTGFILGITHRDTVGVK